MLIKKNILLIENQILQFERIQSLLVRAKYNCLPSSDYYKIFIDHVRIFLDSRYSIEDTILKENSKKYIEDYLNENKIDLVIIDYILSNYHEGESGIYLAKEILSGNNIPVIFLSRTARNELKVKSELSNMDNSGIVKYTWVEKGYLGEQINKKEYFEKYVITEINRLLENRSNIEFDDTSLVSALGNSLYANYHSEIDKLMSKSRNNTLTQIEKEWINNFNKAEIDKRLELLCEIKKL